MTCKCHNQRETSVPTPIATVEEEPIAQDPTDEQEL